MEHIPGPWSCYHEGTREVNDTFVHTFIVVTPNTVAHDNSIGIETSKLIAAAPELLHELTELLDTFTSCLGGSDPLYYDDFKDDIERAQRVIDKAKLR